MNITNNNVDFERGILFTITKFFELLAEEKDLKEIEAQAQYIQERIIDRWGEAVLIFFDNIL